jgi:hypothetical protein
MLSGGSLDEDVPAGEDGQLWAAVADPSHRLLDILVARGEATQMLLGA